MLETIVPNVEKRYLPFVLAIAATGIIGTAYAVPTIFDDTVKISEGNLVVERDNNFPSITVQTNTQVPVIQLKDIDAPQVYQLQLKANGDRFEIRDQTTPRTSFAIVTDSGFVGINTIAPSEQLDVNGNLKLSGNITSSGDICIGSC
jgi:hypothetical protein